jgi:hypothetical protein
MQSEINDIAYNLEFNIFNSVYILAVLLFFRSKHTTGINRERKFNNKKMLTR